MTNVKAVKSMGRSGSRLSLKKKLWQQKGLYLMLAPAFILILIFSYFPLFGWIMAFTDYRLGMNMLDAPWVGLKYFKEFFADGGDAKRVIANTLVMNVGSLVLGLLAALAFAIFLKEVRWKGFQKIVQSVTFFPYFMSWVIIYAVVYALFSNSSGAVNNVLLSLGMIKEPINLLGDPAYSWGLIIGVNVWNILGYNSVIFISAIAGIPDEQYEAAVIDGAGRFAKIWYITLPNLMSTLAVLIIMNSGWIFNSALDQYFVFTNSMNISSMDVFDYYIYRFGLKLGNYSYATAVGIIKTGISILLLVIVNRLSKKLTERSIF